MMKVRKLIFLTLLANQCTHGKFDMYLQSIGYVGNEGNQLEEGDEEDGTPKSDAEDENHGGGT
jgi:hypothetical protein